MKLIKQLESFPKDTKPVILSIGNFDGVHLGHQAILQRVTKIAEQNGATSAIITYENHPTKILRPNQASCLLCSVDQKISLIEKQKIDTLILLKFSKEFSVQTAEEFLHKIRKTIPFTHLIFGHDTVLGKDRQGDKPKIQALAAEMGFEVEYHSEFKIDNLRVSSSLIRQMITQGKFLEVERFLGRKYSIFSKVGKGEKKGTRLGFPTANVSVEDLCLPPLGVYAVDLHYKGNIFKGIANLGIAPTIKVGTQPVLEVHLFDYQDNLYDEMVEVFFKGYIRPEQKFPDIEHLKKQIKQDILQAKAIS